MHRRIEVLTLGANRAQPFLRKDIHELLAGSFDTLFDLSVGLERQLPRTPYTGSPVSEKTPIPESPALFILSHPLGFREDHLLEIG
jgi:hypothetical protein